MRCTAGSGPLPGESGPLQRSNRDIQSVLPGERHFRVGRSRGPSLRLRIQAGQPLAREVAQMVGAGSVFVGSCFRGMILRREYDDRLVGFNTDDRQSGTTEPLRHSVDWSPGRNWNPKYKVCRITGRGCHRTGRFLYLLNFIEHSLPKFCRPPRYGPGPPNPGFFRRAGFASKSSRGRWGWRTSSGW